MNKQPSKSSLMTLLLFTTFIISAWLASNYLSTSDTPKKNTPPSADSFMREVHYTMYDKQGHWQNRFYTPYLQHFSSKNMALMDNPHLISRGQDQLIWNITALHGVSEQDGKIIHLHDNVDVERIQAAGQTPSHLTTTTLTAYPNKKYVVTDQPVTIIQPGSIVHSIGLTADLNTGDIQLLSTTRGTYVKDQS